MTTYNVYELIGNFCEKVFESDNFYEIQDYLTNRFNQAVENGDYENTEADAELFFSYFSIEEEV